MKTLLFIPFLFVYSMVIGQTDNSDSIIGKPIKIGKLEIAQNDFQKSMTLDEAKYACEGLGQGWRLPTKNELNFLFENKDEIGGFANSVYWSSAENNNYYAWSFDFLFGNAFKNYKNVRCIVRAVRDF